MTEAVDCGSSPIQNVGFFTSFLYDDSDESSGDSTSIWEFFDAEEDASIDMPPIVPQFWCQHCPDTFSRHQDAERHQKEVHGPKIFCFIPGCDWGGAKRSYRVYQHLLKKHNISFNSRNQTEILPACYQPSLHKMLNTTNNNKDPEYISPYAAPIAAPIATPIATPQLTCAVPSR